MQQQSVIHDPYSVATPRQITEAAARRARLQRLHSFPSVVEAAPVDKTDRAPAKEEPTETWAQRQKRLHAEPKEPWFSIVSVADLEEPRRPKLQEIISAAARHYGVSRTDILSARRTARIVRPRQVVFYLARKLTLCSLPEIGRRIGGRDHTTALWGIQKIEMLRKSNADLELEIQAIIASLQLRQRAEDEI